MQFIFIAIYFYIFYSGLNVTLTFELKEIIFNAYILLYLAFFAYNLGKLFMPSFKISKMCRNNS